MFLATYYCNQYKSYFNFSKTYSSLESSNLFFWDFVRMINGGDEKRVLKKREDLDFSYFASERLLFFNFK